jgi:hypothetical protein
MNPIRRIRRSAAALAGLALAWPGLAATTRRIRRPDSPAPGQRTAGYRRAA